MLPDPTLTTARLRMRPFTMDDAPRIFALNSIPEVTRHTGDPIRDLAHAETVLRAAILPQYARPGFGRLAVFAREDGAFLGWCGLRAMGGDDVDLGYRFFPEVWGRGIATEAAAALLDHGLYTLGLPRIVGRTAPANLASQRVLTKIGMTPLGRGEEHGEAVERFEARPGSPPFDRPLSPSFFAEDALVVAERLLRAEVTHGGVRLRITEVEAYRFPGDTANHARMGRTARNLPMWGPPGHAYVYLCYGMHTMLNLVTGPPDHPAAVLIRGAEVVEGHDLVATRRPDGRLDGPGKVGAALGIPVASSGTTVCSDGPIGVFPPRSWAPVVRGPRIGIDYAEPADRAAPWRLADAESKQVGRRRALA